ncbi:MAG: hypothetical protein M3475_01180 [Actinomycetota bacterium]|nr:hypothetical protein [Actinomycetota bacterium]
MKGSKSSAAGVLGVASGSNGQTDDAQKIANAKSVVFACDAGMGSSAMGASLLKNKVQKAGLDVAVTNASIANLTDEPDVVVTHKDLTDRAREKAPNAAHVSVESFLGSPKYDELVEQMQNGGESGNGHAEGNGSFDYAAVDKIIFACDAGMGSSAMGASLLRNKAKEAGLTDIEIKNASISQLPDDADVVITHKDLTARAQERLPEAHHISVDNFLDSPKYDELVDEISTTRV